MEKYLFYTVSINDINYTLKIKHLGGFIFLYKNNVFISSGQWFPDDNILFLKSFKAEDIRVKLETVIKQSNPKIIFPYYG